MKSRILAVIVWLSVAMAARAQYNYITNNGTITITGYTGSGGFITIPSAINGLPVTSIGTNAFQGAPNLDGVTIPNSVTNIGDGAFYRLYTLGFLTLGSGLVSIGANAFASSAINAPPFQPLTFPNTLTSIGDTAFESCISIEGVTIPSSVTNIGANPFAGCGLQSIGVATNNPAYTNVSGILFNKSLTVLIGVPQGTGGNYVVPGTVTNIGADAFAYCHGLANVAIPSSVTAIGSNAFFACYGLTNVSIPASVGSIGSGAFSDCAQLTAINVDTNNLAYGSLDGVLFDEGQTTLIGYPNEKPGGTYLIPASVTNIDDEAFYGSAGLTNIIIPSSVVRIGNEAFEDCGNVTNLVIPDSVTSIGEIIIGGDAGIESIVIPGSISNLVHYALAGDFNLKSVYFEGNPPAGDSSIFSGDAGPTVFYLPTASGWGPSYGGQPTAIWQPVMRNPGVQGGQFGFNISWASNLTVTVQANGDLHSTNWTTVQSCTLTNGSFNFSDPNPGSSAQKFYRLSWP